MKTRIFTSIAVKDKQDRMVELFYALAFRDRNSSMRNYASFIQHNINNQLINRILCVSLSNRVETGSLFKRFTA